MKTVIVIPARYQSSRFPGKPLHLILGKPMILWVADLCAKVLSVDCIFIATDNSKIKKVVEDAGYNVVMTSENHLTGTDRIAEAINQIDADIYINVQGDEPLINPADIINISNYKKKYPNYVIKGYCKMEESEDPENNNIPKVIFTEDKQMVYISRSVIPGSKGKNKPEAYYKAVCIYAFSKNELEQFKKFGRKSILENFEDIEILRFLDIGIPVKLVETGQGSIAVDVLEDVKKVEKIMLKNKNFTKGNKN